MKQLSKRPIFWVGSSEKDLAKMPHEVQEVFNFGILLASKGLKHVNAKPLKGYGGNNLVEIVENQRSGSCRAVYTIRFKQAVYVLHVFQKKSKNSIATPKKRIELD